MSNELDRARIVMAEDFRRAKDQFQRSLKSAQIDAEEIFRSVKLESIDRFQAAERMGGACTLKERSDLRHQEVPAAVKHFYASEILARVHGPETVSNAALILIGSVKRGFLRLPRRPLQRLKVACRTIEEPANDAALWHLWFITVLPVLSKTYPRNFITAKEEIWKRMQDSVVACDLLASLIWPTESQPDLKDAQRKLLRAMLVLKAVDSDNRKTTDEIVKNAKSGSSPESFKQPMAALVKDGLVRSKIGRGGGCWLTEKGLARAQQLLISVAHQITPITS